MTKFYYFWFHGESFDIHLGECRRYLPWGVVDRSGNLLSRHVSFGYATRRARAALRGDIVVRLELGEP